MYQCQREVIQTTAPIITKMAPKIASKTWCQSFDRSSHLLLVIGTN